MSCYEGSINISPREYKFIKTGVGGGGGGGGRLCRVLGLNKEDSYEKSMDI